MGVVSPGTHRVPPLDEDRARDDGPPATLSHRDERESHRYPVVARCYLQPRERSALAGVAPIPRRWSPDEQSQTTVIAGAGSVRISGRVQPPPRVRISDHGSTEAPINTAIFQPIWAARRSSDAREGNGLVIHSKLVR